MAVSENKVTTALILKAKTGTKNGQDVFKSITLNNIKGTAAAEDIYTVAAGLGGLLAYPVSSICKQEVNELVNA